MESSQGKLAVLTEKPAEIDMKRHCDSRNHPSGAEAPRFHRPFGADESVPVQNIIYATGIQA